MNRYALAAILGFLLSGAVQAAVIDLGNAQMPHARVADLSTAQRHDVIGPPPASMSALPEPEVLAMMLVGLILIGYRARRDSSDKFE